MSSGAAAVPARRKASVSKRVTRSIEVEVTVAPVEADPPAVVMAVEEAPVAAAPTQQQIAALAYSYWVARGFEPGDPEQDWLRAERELSAK